MYFEWYFIQNRMASFFSMDVSNISIDGPVFENLRNDLKSAHENLEQIALLFIMTRLNLNSDLFFRSA